MKKEATLSQRMKEYELETKLIPRSPMIVRLDGNSFHRVCKNLKDEVSHTRNVPSSIRRAR